MPRLLDRMPFSDSPGEVFFRGERIRVRPNQILLWIHVGNQRARDPSPAAVPFPVLLDTGHNHHFSIQRRHLVEWAGLQPEALAVLGAVRERGQRHLLHAANLWIHTNVRGKREQLVDRPPHLIEARAGIAVYAEGDFPRRPILGLRAIAENELILTVNGKRREATLRTRFRLW